MDQRLAGRPVKHETAVPYPDLIPGKAALSVQLQVCPPFYCGSSGSVRPGRPVPDWGPVALFPIGNKARADWFSPVLSGARFVVGAGGEVMDELDGSDQQQTGQDGRGDYFNPSCQATVFPFNPGLLPIFAAFPIGSLEKKLIYKDAGPARRYGVGRFSRAIPPRMQA